MKSVLKISIFVLLPFLLMQCAQQEDACKGETNPACLCDAIYAPVCGCDEVTYASACVAKCSGIKQFTDGPCAALQNASIVGDWEFLTYASLDAANLINPTKTHPFDVSIKFEQTPAGNNYFKFSGVSSVNSFFGSYTLADGKILLLKELGMTEIAGTITANQFENLFFKKLSGKLGYDIVNKDYLHITSDIDGQIEVMIFKKK
jgi:heat shock protein HslJ